MIDGTCFRVRSIKRKGKHGKYTMESIVHGTLKDYEITIWVCWCQNKPIYVIALYSVVPTLSLFVINPSSPYCWNRVMRKSLFWIILLCFYYLLSVHIYVIFFFKSRVHSPKLLLLLLLFSCLLFIFSKKRRFSLVLFQSLE